MRNRTLQNIILLAVLAVVGLPAPVPLLAVSVTDTGSGIQPEDLPQVFERFQQVGDPLSRRAAGTGLGLPICREIVEYHGGHIWVESVPGEGSTFHFTLPEYEDATMV